MQKSTAKRRVVSAGPIPAIFVHTVKERDGKTRFGLLLTAFMRIVAALWIFEGLLQWSAVLLGGHDGHDSWASLSPAALVAVAFFAVIEPIAAVGLWLAAPWGGVIWLVSAGAQVFVLFVIPDFFRSPIIIGLVDLLLSAGYLGLTWLAARESEGLPASPIWPLSNPGGQKNS